ncbi:hypothetical protein COV93_02560, partial [Candidatus Woesearchaeota archaeon CG11_big_fil_rev_8_21_14_0_20_43_8]
RYGHHASIKRQIFYFEDIVSKLQIETINIIGQKEASRLWYLIGKDVGYRYLLMGSGKKPPYFLLDQILQYIVTNLNGAGLTFAKEIIFEKNDVFIFKGNNNLVCRQSSLGDNFAGFAAGIISFLLGKNVEAKCYCKCPNNCKIIVDPSHTITYIVDAEKLKPIKNYASLNTPTTNENYDFPAFSKLIAFDKIAIQKEGVFYLDKLVIIPYEIGISGIINQKYDEFGLSKFIGTVTKEISEKTWNQIKIQSNDKKQNLKFLFNTLTALGWGIFRHKFEDDIIELTIKSYPISRFSFNFEIYQLNGFINSALDNKYEIIKIDTNESNKSIKIRFKPLKDSS